ncbi:type II toxin-antitoxin system HicB family antitoxin [Falsiroseomonas sp. HW251]|uniref:type II toxin-antitoxin system HicB family antitoxin n=1 Tax=Falsiroseomonas sp. HW251 TaxID=3390998 RepID=UPI003D313A30
MRYIALVDGSEGAYGVVFPDLPGCVAMGGTLDEAMVVASEALGDWINTVEANGGSVPAARTGEQIRADAEVMEALMEGAFFIAVSAVRTTGKPVRANLSLDGGVVTAIDAAAQRRGVTRSAMVEILARQQLPELA